MAQKTDPRLFVDITRIDEDARMVYGYATTEAVDSYGTVIDLARVKEILPDYMRWANIREMHQPSAAGTAQAATVDDTGLYLAAKVVDDAAWNKVKERVYKGFSIGGKKDYETDKRIYLKEITEISLVDRPSNPDCTIDEFRLYNTEDIMDEHTEAGKGKAIHRTSAEAKQRVSELIAALSAEAPDREALQRMATELQEQLGEDIKRGVYEVQWLADLLSSLCSLCACCENEAVWEGDNSPCPPMLKDCCVQLGECLKLMCAEEVDELTGKRKEPDMVGMAEPEPDITRAGARNSKKDLEDLQSIHDACCRLGAACHVEKSASPDITRIEGLESDVTRLGDEVKRLEGENTDLKAEVERLKQEPESPKGALKSVDKGDDVTDTKRQAEEAELKRIESLPPEQQAVELVRIAQRTPHFMRLG